jgi:selenocysteine-specific elongation factor
MRKLILGTAGHIDHGKTSLVRALTGTDTDRLPEEKRRGITIDLGFAALTLPSGVHVGIVDVPGHDAFVRNMLAGATGIDLALLVVAADEGVMPQTREHFAILELLGVRAAVVALTKTDLVEVDWLELVRDDVRELLAHSPLANAPILDVSAKSGSGLDTLVQALDRAASDLTDRTSDDLFRLPIDRVFTIQGTGTVATGTVWSGTLARDDSVVVLPDGRSSRVRGLQAHGQDRPTVVAGERAAIALAGTGRDEVARGQTLVRGTGWRAATMLTVRLRVLRSAPPIRTRQRIRFHLGTAEVLGRIALLESTSVEPGQDTWAQLRLEQAVVARARDRFVIRAYSPVMTIAGGTIVEPYAPKRRRIDAATAATLEAVRSAGPEDALAGLLSTAGWSGIEQESVAVLLGRTPDEVAAALAALHDADRATPLGTRIFDHEIVLEAIRLVEGTVDRIHEAHPLRPGGDRDELRRSLPPLAPPDLAETAIARLVANGRLVAVGPALRRAGFTPQLSQDQRDALDHIAAAIAAAGLAPPSTAELPNPLRARADLMDLIRLLEQAGTVLALRHDLFIDRTALDTAIAGLRTRHGESGAALTPAEFRETFGVSRKYLIPLLEYLDRAGITTRHGDARTVNPL